jgi:hypothetical protein
MRVAVVLRKRSDWYRNSGHVIFARTIKDHHDCYWRVAKESVRHAIGCMIAWQGAQREHMFFPPPHRVPLSPIVVNNSPGKPATSFG